MKIEEISEQEYNVAVINSISKKYKHLRQESKAPTFALTYQGTWKTLVKNLGFPEDRAKQIEAKYHELYKESDEWVANKIEQATHDGYVTCAFGLRVRTPVLQASILNTEKTSKAAAEEARTAGNALGQSWGLLNTRAVNAVMEKIWNSPYREDIRPIMQIHDASYYWVKDDLDVILYLNKILTEEMKWQEDPAISHPTVHLGGELDIFYPDWAHPITISNNITKPELIKRIQDEQK